MTKSAEQTEAMRRFLLISPLLEPALSEAEASARRRALLATRTPDGMPLLSARTVRRWLEHYRTGGLEALSPRHRRDRGLVKTMTPDVLDAAIALKEELPTRSVRAILEILEQEGADRSGSGDARHARPAPAPSWSDDPPSAPPRRARGTPLPESAPQSTLAS